MPFSGGAFTRLYSWQDEAAADNPISSVKMDAEFDGIATGLSTCITKDGQSTVTANIPFSGFRLTNVGNPSGAQDAATKNYVDTTAVLLAGPQTVGGNKTFTGTTTISGSLTVSGASNNIVAEGGLRTIASISPWTGTTAGAAVNPEGVVGATRSAGSSVAANRTTSDGLAVQCFRDGASVGGLSVTSTTTSLVTSSDERLKDDLTPLDPDVVAARVLQLTPVSFRWKATGEDDWGFSAQQVSTVFPTLVWEDDETGMWMVDVSSPGTLAAMVAMLQRLWTDNADLRERVAALEAA